MDLIGNTASKRSCIVRCLLVAEEKVFTVPLLSKGRLFLCNYSRFQLSSHIIYRLRTDTNSPLCFHLNMVHGLIVDGLYTTSCRLQKRSIYFDYNTVSYRSDITLGGHNNGSTLNKTNHIFYHFSLFLLVHVEGLPDIMFLSL
jgi:hypothetical protein